ncbi:hypothetical protein Leryth_025484 [Lithospermum erythrorhizon]|nr:hypothetical protein Leryth_025484 [Lithospermum erythrorhizon]
MESLGLKEDLGSTLHRQPPVIAPNMKPERVEQSKYEIVSRPAFGSSGRHINLLANHFKVSVRNPDQTFYQYTVSIISEEKKEIISKGIRRKVIDRIYQIYSTELHGEKFAYDGDKSLYTIVPLPHNNLDFTVLIEDTFAKCNGSIDSSKRCKQAPRSRTFSAAISYAAKIPLCSISLPLQRVERESTQDSLRVLDIILRQQAANRGFFLVRQSFFHDDSRNFVDVGGGVTGFRGFHSSFRPTHGGLSLNLDVSTTMILTPGPVIDFILANQNVKDHRHIDWQRAKKMLKGIRIKTRHSNMELKIIGLSERPCNQQLFTFKMKSNSVVNGEEDVTDITVDEYFTKHHNIELTFSRLMPCLDVGKPKRPIYLPIELCSVVSLQRYRKELSGTQRASLVEKSRQKPDERILVLTDVLKKLLPLFFLVYQLRNSLQLVAVAVTPKLKIGNNEDCIPRNGRWNYSNKHFLNPMRIDSWAVVNFSQLLI